MRKRGRYWYKEIGFTDDHAQRVQDVAQQQTKTLRAVNPSAKPITVSEVVRQALDAFFAAQQFTSANNTSNEQSEAT